MVITYDAIFPTDATTKFLEATTQLLQSNDTVEIDGNSGKVLSVQVEDGTIVKMYSNSWCQFHVAFKSQLSV